MIIKYDANCRKQRKCKLMRRQEAPSLELFLGHDSKSQITFMTFLSHTVRAGGLEGSSRREGIQSRLDMSTEHILEAPFHHL